MSSDVTEQKNEGPAPKQIDKINRESKEVDATELDRLFTRRGELW